MFPSTKYGWGKGAVCSQSMVAQCQEHVVGKNRKRKMCDDGVVSKLHLKPTPQQVCKRRWLSSHWDFMQKHKLCPRRIRADLPPGLPARAAHIIAIHRALCASKGQRLEVVNVSQSVHRAGVSTKLVMPCITPNGQFWVERESRVISPIEKLLFMGLPVANMDLGGLSGREMGSLAGNGMHSWVGPSA